MNSEPRIVERRQTLWDLPSTTPASLANIPSFNGPRTHEGMAPFSPTNPPLLGKPEPLALPPTPTARWFDPTSHPQLKAQGSSLNLRKQSLGLWGLQMPDSPSSTEILSPLTLSTPKNAIPQAMNDASPTPLSRVSEPVASTSRLLLEDVHTHSESKGKQRDTDIDSKTIAADFARRGSTVRTCFEAWKKKATDKAAWALACTRSDMYKEKVQRKRLTSSTSVVPDESPESNAKKRRLSGVPSSDLSQPERHRRRISNQYKAPVTDDGLAKRLKEVRSDPILSPLSSHIHEHPALRTTKSINDVGRKDHSYTRYAPRLVKHYQKIIFLLSGESGSPRMQRTTGRLFGWNASSISQSPENGFPGISSQSPSTHGSVAQPPAPRA